MLDRINTTTDNGRALDKYQNNNKNFFKKKIFMIYRFLK